MGGQLDRAARILAGATRTTYHEQDGKIHLNTYQDVQPHLDYAARARRADREHGRFSKKSDLRPGMHVPHNVLMGIAKKLGIAPANVMQPGYAERIWKELKSVEYKNFRLHDSRRV
jgi:hypothetical protein